MAHGEHTDNRSSAGEKLSWRLLRPPPMAAVAFGALYGLIAGMFIVYDIAVLIRTGKALAPKLKERLPIVGSRDEDGL